MNKQSSYQWSAVARFVGGGFMSGIVLGMMLSSLLFQGHGIAVSISTLTTLSDGLTRLIVSLTALAAALVTLLTAINVMVKTSPKAAIDRVIEIAKTPGEPQSVQARDAILVAAAETPGVEKVVAPTIAASVPSDKVVAS